MPIFTLPSSESSTQPVETSVDQSTRETPSPKSSHKTSPAGSAQESRTTSQSSMLRFFRAAANSGRTSPPEGKEEAKDPLAPSNDGPSESCEATPSPPSTRHASMTRLFPSDPEEDEEYAGLMMAEIIRLTATPLARRASFRGASPNDSAGGSPVTSTASSADSGPGIVGGSKKRGFIKELQHTFSVVVDAAKCAVATGKDVWESLKSNPMVLLGVDKLCVALAPEVPTLRLLPEEITLQESPATVLCSFPPVVLEEEEPAIPIGADVSEPIRPFVAVSRWRKTTSRVSSALKRRRAKAEPVTGAVPVPAIKDVRPRGRSLTTVNDRTALQCVPSTVDSAAENISGPCRDRASSVEMFKPHRAECMVAIKGVGYILAVIWFVGFDLVRHILCNGSTWKGAVIPLALFGAFSHIWLAVIIPCYAHRHPRGIQAGDEPRKIKTTIVFLINFLYGLVLLALNKDALHGYFDMDPAKVRVSVRHGRISRSLPGWAKAILLAHWLLRVQAVLTGWYFFGQALSNLRRRDFRPVAAGLDEGFGWGRDPIGYELALDVLLIGAVMFLEILITRKLTVWGLHLLYTSKQQQDSKRVADEKATERRRDKGPEDAGPSRKGSIG